MAWSTKISIFLALAGIAFVACFFFTLFLSGDPLLTADVWQQDKSMPAKEARAWRKNPEAYAAPTLEITPEMNPVSIAIAHWSKAVGFPRSSRFTLAVEDSTGRAVLNKEIRLSQKKNEGGSGTVIFEWTSDTPSINLLNDYLEVTEAGTCTFRLMPGEPQAGNHSRLQLRLRKQATRPQWWMFIAGFPMVFIAVGIFMFSGFRRMRRVLRNRIAVGKNE